MTYHLRITVLSTLSTRRRITELDRIPRSGGWNLHKPSWTPMQLLGKIRWFPVDLPRPIRAFISSRGMWCCIHQTSSTSRRRGQDPPKMLRCLDFPKRVKQNEIHLSSTEFPPGFMFGPSPAPLKNLRSQVVPRTGRCSTTKTGAIWSSTSTSHLPLPPSPSPSMIITTGRWLRGSKWFSSELA